MGNKTSIHRNPPVGGSSYSDHRAVSNIHNSGNESSKSPGQTKGSQTSTVKK